MMKLRLIIIFILFIWLLSGSQLPFELRYLAENEVRGNLSQSSYLSPLVETREGYAAEVILKGDFPLSELPENASRIARWHEFTTLILPLSELKELEDITGVEEIYPSLQSEILLDVSTSDHMSGNYYAGCDADYVQEQFGSGEGVIIGVIDPYPLNWQHEDFQGINGTRIQAIWDQNTAGSSPIGFGYGSEFEASDLNNNIGPGISTGLHHGTQCAGIAAGNGNASDGVRAGMAPESDIIYVEYTGNSVDLINAIAYISMKAAEIDPSKPVVISSSVGAMFNHPDGSDPVAQALQSFGGVGKVSAVAAGNWYNYDCFATGSAVYGDPMTDLNFTLSGSNTGGNDFVICRLYYIAGDDFSVSVTSPSENIYGPVPPGNDQTFTTVDGELYIYHDQTVLNNPYIEIVVSDESGVMTAGDNWTVELSVPSENLDDNGGWWWGWIAGVGYGAEFENYYAGAYSLNTYACAANTVCAGAHDRNSGAIYSACSKGAPDAVIKPEITAPTNAYTTNAASSTGYSSLCCTSGAAPHVAGAMAILLQRFPQLTATEVIERLEESAWQDGQTGIIPNNRWGYGKLNAKGAYLLYPSLGDVDNSGETDAYDSSIILMLTVGINFFEETDPLPWEDWRFQWADVDGNEVIDSYDASLILQYVVELISQFPVEE
ncbi:MAG: S8 family serine peptidase [Candidatus Cloacimonetes bacterium]|nr:S8 family serine peptidase [Candidatus Cloacimonadota bacterium]